MNLTEEWKNRFEKMWHPNDQARYRLGSAGARYAKQFMSYVPAGATINEYGSGTGRAVVEIRHQRPDVRINMIDIASNALEPEAKAMIGDEVTYAIGDLSALPADFPVADWGYCVGVLMLVAPETLDDILSETRRTCRNMFIEVYNLSDVRCNIELTTIRQPWEWWHEKLREFWPRVEFIQSKEHRQRFIFVCRETAHVIPNVCEESKISPFGRNDKEKAVITITAGWSGDSVYSLEDVNKLIRGVRRNTSIPHDFILYAGPEAQKPGKLAGLESGVTVIPSEYPSWWVGMQGADPDNRPWIKTDSIFGLGLDCVIVGNLDDLIMYPSDRAGMKDYPSHCCPKGKEQDCSLEVTLYRHNSDRVFWNEYVRVGKPTWDYRNIPSDAVFKMCGQGWVNDTRAVHVDLFPENWVISYKLGVRGRSLPEDCRIVSFHGHPKPGDVNEPWLSEAWR